MTNLNFILSITIFFFLLFDRFNIFLYTIIASIIHESVHIFFYILLYKKIPKLKFSIFGISLKNNYNNQNKNLIILIFAPLINIIIAIIGLMNLEIKFTISVFVFSYVNLIIGLINFLPIEYLDGGRVLDILFLNYTRYSKVINIVCMIILFIILIFFSSDKIRTGISLLIFFIYYLINVKKS